VRVGGPWLLFPAVVAALAWADLWAGARACARCCPR
jgi:hypothetical protein